jgi:hypothetical protein
VIAINNYPYVGIDYRGDPNMPFAPSSTYGDIGKKIIFIYFVFLVFFSK